MITRQPAIHATFIINADAGSGDAASICEDIRDAAARVGIVANVKVCAAAEIAAVVRDVMVRAPNQKLIVAVGGDGTVSCVARAIMTADCALGVLPRGTLNHFANDLGLPIDLDAAMAIFAAGKTRRIDVGDVNGRIFVNNSAIGLYPALVTDRDRQRARLGRSKWLAHLLAAIRVAFRFPSLIIWLETDGAVRRIRTPLLFIGNNEYRAELLGLFPRHTLQDGRLVAHLVHRAHWWGALSLLLRLATGRTRQCDMETIDVTSLKIDSRRRTLRVSLDGEVLRLQTPLSYRIRAAALSVVVGT